MTGQKKQRNKKKKSISGAALHLLVDSSSFGHFQNPASRNFSPTNMASSGSKTQRCW